MDGYRERYDQFVGLQVRQMIVCVYVNKNLLAENFIDT